MTNARASPQRPPSRRTWAARALNNGGEPYYATEKLWKAFQATVRALIHGLDSDPRQLI